MKLKDIKDKNGKGLLPEKKVEKGRGFTEWYNKACDEIGEKEICIDVDEVEKILQKCHRSIREIAQAIAKADILKVR